MIRATALVRQYGAGAAQVAALAGVDLEVAAGEFVALMGPSGSGKSTLMQILGLLDRATAGRYEFQGRPADRLGASASAALRGRAIGFVFQGIHLLPSLDALANVELPMVYARVPAAERGRRAREALSRVGLLGMEHRLPAELSGGQGQRVAIARAVAPGPALLLADEPTGALDRQSGRDVLGIFQDLNEGTTLTIVVVTHDPFVADHAGRVVELEDGRIVGDRPVPAERRLREGSHAEVTG